MVIQRWQSVLLFFAGLAMCLFAFIPVCDIVFPDEVVSGALKNALPLFILDLLVGLLMFIAIFLYGDLKLQKKVVLIADLLLVVLIAGCALYYINVENAVGTVWNWSVVLPVLALILSVWGYRRIKADENTLRSYDRIR